jgi:hypothetical protein
LGTYQSNPQNKHVEQSEKIIAPESLMKLLAKQEWVQSPQTALNFSTSLYLSLNCGSNCWQQVFKTHIKFKKP